MTRAEICASDDYETVARLLAAIHACGGGAGGDDGDALGVGLHRFTLPGGELTVFVDAWRVDLAGPEPLVNRVLAALTDSN